MSIQSRPTLTRYFETGKGLSNRAFVDVIDSIPSVVDTTAQVFNAALNVPSIVITGTVSAGSFYAAGNFTASAATFPGRITQGVSGASQGIPVVSQESTVAATATSRIGTLPPNSNIVGLGIRVLAASSGAGGGTTINAGDGSAIDFFGSITVSAVGSYQFTNVSARRLANVSGAVWMAGITATANSNFIGRIEYYQGTIMAVAVSYATWNSGDKAAGVTTSNNDLTTVVNNAQSIRSTGAKSSGKWYAEFTIDSIGAGAMFAVANSSANINNYPAADANGWGYFIDGNKYNAGGATNYGATFTTADKIGIALDMDNGKVWFSKNGVWQASGDPAAGTGAAFTGLTGSLMAMTGTAGAVMTVTGNWGATAFAYTAPVGFAAWSVG